MNKRKRNSDPTQQEIAAACELLRGSWSPDTRYHRSVAMPKDAPLISATAKLGTPPAVVPAAGGGESDALRASAASDQGFEPL